jgi:very-short-patch-repair endonuclease
MTKQERHLWYDFLRNHTYKWYKQKPIEPYIVDFFCSKAKLIVELDGSQHYDENQREYDMKRTTYLQKLGIIVIRFPNNELDKNFLAVCEEINKTLAIIINN